jgi:hypothetical protein
MKQQQPRPSGPHSPWPNPAYMPADWVSAQQQQSQQQPSAAAAAAAASPLSHPIAADESVDVDWTPRSPLDPHRCAGLMSSSYSQQCHTYCQHWQSYC